MSRDRGWDWEAFYHNADYDRCLYLAGDAMIDYAERFIDRVGVPGRMADVGCGPGVLLFELAERYPGTAFRGFDVSRTVVADNAELAAERGLDNLEFAVAALPDLDVDGRFDLVYCVATLYFVERPRRALRALYDRVAPGGHLVVDYPTEELRRVADAEFEGRKREAFEPVIEGRNLLTAAEVAGALGAEPRDYWSLVDADPDHRTRAMVAVER